MVFLVLVIVVFQARVCAVFQVLVVMVKLLSLDPLPGWSGDGSIPLWYLSPVSRLCTLALSHAEL